MKWTDEILEQKIVDLQSSIQGWAIKHELWTDSFFRSYSEEFDDEPDEDVACVTMLISEGGMFSMFNAHIDGDYLEEFEAFLDKTDFYCEKYDHYRFQFFAQKEDLNNAYLEYFEWKWISELIKPDYTSLYDEIFNYFAKYPHQIPNLHWRRFEVLISEIFKNQGYKTLLGSGQNDQGIDLRIYEKEGIDPLATIVQIKKYKSDSPIKLEAVAALTGVVHTSVGVDNGLFVTSSRFLPSAIQFAARERSRIKLADSTDVIKWCEETKSKIVRDKSKLFDDSSLMEMISGKSFQDLTGKIFVASVGYGIITNDFCIVVKDTPDIALIMCLPKERPKDHLGHTLLVGYERPILNEQILEYRQKKYIFRAKKSIDPNGGISLSANKHTYYMWNNSPIGYDDID